jgi:hypothetical protein
MRIACDRPDLGVCKEKYTLTSDRSITANEMTYSKFWVKLSFTVLGTGKQIQLSARQKLKLTITGSRLHIKANSPNGQDGERLGHDVSTIDDAQRRDYTDGATAAALANSRQLSVVIAVMSCHRIRVRVMLRNKVVYRNH